MVMFGYTTVAAAQSVGLDRFDTVSAASDFAEAIVQARAEIQVLMDAGAPGVSIAVGVDEQLIWAEGFGYANVEFRVPATPLTKFRIGSVSKSMTSIAMALLYEQGVIDLDAPIQAYLSEFPVKEKGRLPCVYWRHTGPACVTICRTGRTTSSPNTTTT